jgi:hypothetical protein
MLIKAIDNGYRSFPPKGKYTSPRPFGKPFSAIEIPQIPSIPPLRPECVRQPLAEGRIMSRIKAKLQGRTGLGTPLNPSI